MSSFNFFDLNVPTPGGSGIGPELDQLDADTPALPGSTEGPTTAPGDGAEEGEEKRQRAKKRARVVLSCESSCVCWAGPVGDAASVA